MPYSPSNMQTYYYTDINQIDFFTCETVFGGHMFYNRGGYPKNCCHDNRGLITSPLQCVFFLLPSSSYDSEVGRIQLAGTHCGSSCAFLTAVSSCTHESCRSSLTIMWSKNCPKWSQLHPCTHLKHNHYICR